MRFKRNLAWLGLGLIHSLTLGCGDSGAPTVLRDAGADADRPPIQPIRDADSAEAGPSDAAAGTDSAAGNGAAAGSGDGASGQGGPIDPPVGGAPADASTEAGAGGEEDADAPEPGGLTELQRCILQRLPPKAASDSEWIVETNDLLESYDACRTPSSPSFREAVEDIAEIQEDPSLVRIIARL